MKLSIIIPAYNVEDTLGRCLDSIISQNFKDWQMILVDDASPDSSGRICDSYAARDSRIKVIHRTDNGGLSAARNNGLAAAEGHYITFADSDDFLAPETLSPLIQTMESHPEYDILEYPVSVHYGGKGQEPLSFVPKVYTDMTEYWLRGKAYLHTYAWNKVYRRHLFDTVRFPEGKTFEDAWTLPRLLRLCGKVATTDKGLYYYCDNPKGITRQASSSDIQNLLEAHLDVIGQLHPTPSQSRFPQKYEADFAEYYASVLNTMLDLSDTGGSLHSFPILPYRQTLKLKLLHILGLKHLCQLHRIFRHSH